MLGEGGGKKIRNGDSDAFDRSIQARTVSLAKVLLAELFSERQRFEELGLKISPLDVIDILFKCKMVFAVQDENEYMKRIGGGMENIGLWREKATGTVDLIIDRHFDRLGDSLCERTFSSK